MSIPVNISASRGAGILGLSKWSTPVQEFLKIMGEDWCIKSGYEFPVVEYSSVMRWGHAFESAIIELAESKNNSKIIDREKLFEKDFISCHIDGYYNFSNPKFITTRTLHEGKTTSAFYFKDNFGIPGTDQVPIEYQIQCQHQMICTGAEKVILSVLVFPKMVDEWESMGWVADKNISGEYRLFKDKMEVNPIEWAFILNDMGYFHQYEISAHPELQKLMIEKYTSFWNDHVLTGIPPKPKSYDDIKALVREPVGTIIADEEITNLMAEYKQIKQELGSSGNLSNRAEMIKVEILNYMRDKEKIDDDDSQDKFILRGQDGKRLASYSKNKKGSYVFR